MTEKTDEAGYPDFLVIPHQLIRNENLQPTDRILYGVIYWYAKMKLEKCFASNKTLSKLCGGISERAVRASLARLEKEGFIERVVSNFSRVEIVPIITMGGGTNVPKGGNICSEGGGTNVPHNKNIYNKTIYNKQGAEIVESFLPINPSASRWYGNTTQRKACDDLIDSYGLERVVSIVKNTLPKTNKLPYFPTITSPVQLRDKWSQLESAVYKAKGKQKTFIVV